MQLQEYTLLYTYVVIQEISIYNDVLFMIIVMEFQNSYTVAANIVTLPDCYM